MAPKKMTKGKEVEAKPTRDEGWTPSKCSYSDLDSLVSAGLLPSKSVIQWHSALGQDRPYENTGEIVAFAPYFERGLGLPCSSFFSGLLYYYRIQLHHLTPNSFVHVTIFVHLCEAFLGIEPHFELSRHLFHLKPQPNSIKQDVVGGVGIQLRQGIDRVYIPYKLSSKVIDWKPKWLYIANHGETFPVITPGPPIRRLEWNKKPIDDNQIPKLLEQIANLRQRHITGEAVMKRRIQPLQARETFGFQYQGTSDLSRCSEKEISNGEVLSRVQRLLKKVEHVPLIPDTFSASNPPKQV